MRKKWSRMWVKSVQPRKQRKYRHNAPLHVRHKFLSVNLAPEIRSRFEKRSMPVRKGDEVEVMRGSVKGLRGTVNRVDMKNSRVYVEEIKVKKVDGSEMMRPLQPSNLKITKLALDDKRRQMVIDRAEKRPEKKVKKEEKKKEHKSEKKQESKPRTRRMKKHKLRAHKKQEKKNRPKKPKTQHKTEKKPEKKETRKETKTKPKAVKSKKKAVKKGKVVRSKKNKSKK